jgi:8-amino-7-oxononanoate synthase
MEKNLQFYKQEIEKRRLILNSDSLIKIVPEKDNKTLLFKQKELLNKNILVGAIRAPTVKTPIYRVIGRVNTEIDIIRRTLEYLKE